MAKILIQNPLKKPNSAKNASKAEKTSQNICKIVFSTQDLKKQDNFTLKIADEEYLRALKIHQDPRKADLNVSFEVINSVDKLVYKHSRPASTEPNQRLSFENWKKNKSIQNNLRKFYLKKKLEEGSFCIEKNHEKRDMNEVFQVWLDKKIKEKRREKREKSREKREKRLRNGKITGLSYKQWLHLSLAKEKEQRHRKRAAEEMQGYHQQELEMQKSYEKQAQKYLEKKEQHKRLSRLKVKRPMQSSFERYSTHSPLLLAYSPNKNCKVHDQSLSNQSKLSSLAYEDF